MEMTFEGVLPRTDLCKLFDLSVGEVVENLVSYLRDVAGGYFLYLLLAGR